MIRAPRIILVTRDAVDAGAVLHALERPTFSLPGAGSLARVLGGTPSHPGDLVSLAKAPARPFPRAGAPS